MTRWGIAFLLFLLTPTTISAEIALTLNNLPPSINVDQEFEADATLDCTSCGISYLRGVFFYPESSHTYSGFSLNNAGQWISTSDDKTQYFKIEEGSYSGKLKFKFDPQKPPGSYFFKLGRYTASGDSFAQTSSSLPITVTGPSPTPTSIPPTSAPAPTSTPKPPTSTPKPTPTPTPLPKFTIIPTLSISVGPEEKVLATFREAEPTLLVKTDPTPEILSTSTSSHNWLAAILISIGLVGLGLSLVLFSHPSHIP
ncbi:hypothetical protein A2634_05180 [Candidatus Amesbacteria bacterium RIFCSPHIGHO2_01_FULL_48_32]|uniref:Uncharacterized protein n=1 Tax=Candidatus Amesbacteria bacterium RIFCSPLOWO2_01_FULL_48_25 TaxID=1797259 RepID=A0A1F4ZCR6_9BACT|nr:MAG: hypothetical protein A2634_05180 [Candidatus Amesbacteria bacterium RIFCSPHIGHO2_01_FULL_48_32]OGD04061.1 MAG: hypothetical protein A2989_01525 [Candidatus Amesbacteria bacterium RIFCSPLOWO2_01_FULL_48_25]HJZ05675.1 hypothetical protein [Patescibacteria group bacterium]